MENKNTEGTSKMFNTETNTLKNDILYHISKSNAIFKSQQKDEPELTIEEKHLIASDLLRKNPCLFLIKFGHYLKKEHLEYFSKKEEKDENYEISYYIKKLQRYFNNSSRQIDIKNRRYEALKLLIEKGEYFSENEMRKRNPLLYDHLIGQYLTEEEKKERNNPSTNNETFLNILMADIEENGIRAHQKMQQEQEDNAEEEEEEEEEQEDEEEEKKEPNNSNAENVYESKNMNTLTRESWGEILSNDNQDKITGRVIRPRIAAYNRISNEEKELLKKEFVTNMYQSFLDGLDNDFDYSTVDNNEAYDNVELRTLDEEEKYFDSESPETVSIENKIIQSESEDELDVYMKSLKVN